MGCSHGASGGSNLLLKNNNGQAMSENVMKVPQLLDVSTIASLPRTNPFLSLIVPPADAAPADSPTTPLPDKPADQPKDPFSSLSLGGIMYHGRNSLAIVTPEGGQSYILHNGQVFSISTDDMTYQAKVSHIDRTSLGLKILNPPSDLPPGMASRILRLESLIGYQGKSKGGDGGGSASSVSHVQSTSSGPTASSDASSDDNNQDSPSSNSSPSQSQGSNSNQTSGSNANVGYSPANSNYGPSSSYGNNGGGYGNYGNNNGYGNPGGYGNNGGYGGYGSSYGGYGSNGGYGSYNNSGANYGGYASQMNNYQSQGPFSNSAPGRVGQYFMPPYTTGQNQMMPGTTMYGY